MGSIILFDGVCNFCNQSVQFIIQNDPAEHYKFASLQGDIGKRLLNQYHVDKDINSIVLIENEKSYLKSSAALRISMKLNWPWKLFGIFLLIPRFIRDFFYDIVAKNRYRWFGRQENCMLPSPNLKERFLDKEENGSKSKAKK
ncbi:MAG: hypothetical protein K0S25_1559 [Bacillus sp. (in: firmicutes)]|jgi:predicted DCC family thiol-disulfide oxidoreductase YuxK|nr:hypothetical protein [Bacillus sp. (in: firmicutes)]